MKNIYLFIFAFLTVNVVIAATPPTPVIYNFENPSVNQLTFNNAQIATTTPVFRVGTPTGATNPNLIYIEINTSAAFTGTDWTQTFSGSFVNGTANDFTFTNGFAPTNGVTYYVRAQASADGGSTYSSFSSGTFSFTYQTSGNTDWYQTTQAQFLTDSLSGTTATSSSGVQLTSTSGGGNVFTNGSFESGLTSWTNVSYEFYSANCCYGVNANSTTDVTNGTYSADMYIDDGFSGNWYGGDFTLLYQDATLTGVSNISMSWGYANTIANTLDCNLNCGSGDPYAKFVVLIDNGNTANYITASDGSHIDGTAIYTSSLLDVQCNNSTSGGPFLINVPISSYNFTGTCRLKLVAYVNGYPNVYCSGTYFHVYVDNVQGTSAPSGTITSTAVDLASVKGATGWSTLQWNQTLNGGFMTLAVQKCISGTWTNEITGITSATSGANSNSISSIPVTTSYDSIRVVATLTTTAGGTSPSLNSWAITETVPSCTTPPTPTVLVTNNCNSTSTLSTTATGSLSWNTGATTTSITVTAGTYSVTQTVGGCTSASGTGIAAPGTTPSTPVVTVLNSCNGSTSVLSTTATGSLLWNTGATTTSITVTAGTYSVTQTVGGCTSASGTGIAAPGTTPSTPAVTVLNTCNGSTSTLSTTATGSLLWNTGATTTSITVTAGTYSVTQTVGGCTSASGTGIAAPGTTPSTPVVTVLNSCNGSTSVLSTTATGSLLWNTGATTTSITVTAGTYSVTQTVGGCTSASGTGIAAPGTTPSTPVVTVLNRCNGSTSVLSTTATGSLLWNTGATTTSITVTAGTYSVTQTVSGCTSAAGTNTAAPLNMPSTPIVSVTNNCGNSVLSTTATGALLWNTGETTSSITVTAFGIYSVTQTAEGCTSDAGTGVAQPTSLTPPIISATNYCGYSVLSTTASGDTLLWSTGATTTSITVTDQNTYSVTLTESAGCSATGTGSGAPFVIPPAPSVTVTNNCGYSILSTPPSNIAGSLIMWSTGATTSAITVSVAGTYSATYTLEACTSPVGTGTAAPTAIPDAPTVVVADNCGNSVLSTAATGALSWSTGETTSSITVTAAGTYSVTQTVNTCTSPADTGTAGPIAIPDAPTVVVADNCGNSVLSTTATGALSWSTGETSSSITVTAAGTYSVTQTVSTCTSPSGTGNAAPSSLATPVVTVVNNCGNSVLSTTATGALLWNTGATTSSITVTTFAIYSVTQAAGACTSDAGTGIAEPTTLLPPIVSVANYCGYAVLSTPANGDTLLWSTGETTTSITVTDQNTYSVTITQSAGCSATGTGSGAPYPIPPAPPVTVTNNCGYSILSISSTDIAGSLIMWSTGATTTAITVSIAGTYSVTYTLEVCTSAVGTGTADPLTIPAPGVTVINNCDSSVLTATGFTGSLLWSTSETTTSITVTTAGTYSVTQTVNGCTSPSGTVIAAPIESCGGGGKNLYPGYACGDFNNGHGRILTSICYQVKKDLVSNVQPGVFSYFAKVVAPSASFCVDVIQTKSCGNSLTFFEVDHNEQTFILDANCGRIDHNSATITSSPTEQTVGICIDNAIVNKTYIIAVKYDAKSIEGSIQGGDCIYTFSSRIVGGSTIPNSTSTLDAIQGCHGSRTADPTDNSSVDGITLTAYPNPFSDKATILLVSDIDYNNVTVEIYNLMGQKTREIYYGPVKANESAQIEIDGSEMENGIYIYRVIAGEESYYGRIILQKN